jgi:branched-chain amino acid transport system ATP-binding protein
VAALLELVDLSKRFGQVVVAEALSLSVGEGEAVGVVGPNGAGKTTLFGMISGELAPDSGEIRFDGRPIIGLDAAVRCRLGIGRTFQVPRPFQGMTVFENVLVAAHQGGGHHGTASYTAAARVLEQTGLAEQSNRLAGRLGLLDRKRLEMARALATEPRLLLLDEVAGGLTEPEMSILAGIVRDVLSRGTAVIWIEHVMRALTATVERLVCLAVGRKVGDGDPVSVLADPQVRELFLGNDPVAEALAAAAAPASVRSDASSETSSETEDTVGW